MKRKVHVQAGLNAQGVFCIAGWSLAVLMACLLLPHVYRRLAGQSSQTGRVHWLWVLENKKAEISAFPWKDARPLSVMAGDSHIELANWYDLFEGAYAVRNYGLSQATISDVTQIIKVSSDRNPKVVILMCGINNIGRGDAVKQCIKDYEELLIMTRSVLNPQKIVVLSVIPYRLSPGDNRTFNMNQEVFSLNKKLGDLCRRGDAVFVNITGELSDHHGGLSPELTADGLHLNVIGYKKVADAIRSYLPIPQP